MNTQCDVLYLPSEINEVKNLAVVFCKEVCHSYDDNNNNNKILIIMIHL